MDTIIMIVFIFLVFYILGTKIGYTPEVLDLLKTARKYPGKIALWAILIVILIAIFIAILITILGILPYR